MGQAGVERSPLSGNCTALSYADYCVEVIKYSEYLGIWGSFTHTHFSRS